MGKVLHLSDLHFGAHDESLLSPFAGAIEKIAPDIVIVSGDVTQKGKRSEFKKAQAFMNRFSAPVILAAGNHDTPMFQIFSRTFSPFARLRSTLGAYMAQEHIGDDLHIATLHTPRGIQFRLDWSLGVANKKDVRQAIKKFEETPDDCLKLIVCHHPLLAPSNTPFPPRTLHGKKAAKAFTHAGIDAVLSGHLHTRFAEPYSCGDGKTYAIGAGTTFSAKRTRGEPPGFNLITADDDFLHVDFYSWDKDFQLNERKSFPRRGAHTDLDRNKLSNAQ